MLHKLCPSIHQSKTVGQDKACNAFNPQSLLKVLYKANSRTKANAVERYSQDDIDESPECFGEIPEASTTPLETCALWQWRTPTDVYFNSLPSTLSASPAASQDPFKSSATSNLSEMVDEQLRALQIADESSRCKDSSSSSCYPDSSNSSEFQGLNTEQMNHNAELVAGSDSLVLNALEVKKHGLSSDIKHANSLCFGDISFHEDDNTDFDVFSSVKEELFHDVTELEKTIQPIEKNCQFGGLKYSYNAKNISEGYKISNKQNISDVCGDGDVFFSIRNSGIKCKTKKFDCVEQEPSTKDGLVKSTNKTDFFTMKSTANLINEVADYGIGAGYLLKSVNTRKNCEPVRQGVSVSTRKGNIVSHDRLYRVLFAGSLQLPFEDVVVNRVAMAAILHQSVTKFIDESGFMTMASRLQAFMWPVVSRGQNVIAVGERCTGKTVGYVLPLVSLLLDMWPCIAREARVRIGAVAVVVCKGWRAAQCLADTFSHILTGHGLRVMGSWGGVGNNSLDEIRKDIFRGADVLVTTLPFLLRVIGANKNSDNNDGDDDEEKLRFDYLSHCFHLVIDDADVILDSNASGVKLLLKQWACSRATSNNTHFSQQLIVTASSWTDYIESLAQFMFPLMEPTLIISSPLEAARASYVKSVVHICDSTALSTQQALGDVVDLVKDQTEEKKMLIFVANRHEGQQLRRVFESVAVFTQVVHGKLLAWEVQEVVRAWTCAPAGRILMVSASTVPLLLEQDLRDADVLVHVHIPKTRQEFAQRFTFLMDKYIKDFSSEVENPPVSHVVVGRSFDLLPSYLKDSLKHLRTAIPAELQFRSNIQLQKHIPLCHKLKAFGSCSSVSLCEWRHKTLEEDLACKLPDHGIVTLEIVTVLNASRYLVRLTEYRESNSCELVDLSGNHFTMFMTLQSYCSEEANLHRLTCAHVGLLCLINYEQVWARARVLHVHQSPKPKVTVFLMDEGTETSVEVHELYELPEEFSKLPQLVLEVYLCKVRPLDHDTDWTHVANVFVEKLFSSTCEEGDSNRSVRLTGNIVLSLSSTMWVSPLVEIVTVEGKNIRKESVRSQLIRCGYGCGNPGHIDMLKEHFSAIATSGLAADTREWLSFWTVGSTC